MLKEEAESYIGVNVVVAYKERGHEPAKVLHAEGIVIEISNDEDGEWLVFDWGFAVRLDAITEISKDL